MRIPGSVTKEKGIMGTDPIKCNPHVKGSEKKIVQKKILCINPILPNRKWSVSCSEKNKNEKKKGAPQEWAKNEKPKK